LNRIQKLADFMEYNAVDPMIIANKEGSYYGFLVKIKENESTISKRANDTLVFLTREVLPGKRRQEIVLMQHLVDNKIAGMTYQEIGDLFSSNGLDDNRVMVSSVVRTLSTEYFDCFYKKIYQSCKVIILQYVLLVL